ncbi:histidine phosphatase family protein [uncultured Psychroserpens sp.]|uniref:SixA phosphatase family protein n=1 Tax=uncultured Psychroserpens sp. TaxID=255436 RepID=UPI0026088CD9|nr:histidine phosphatase family protein [uncultured Psychroserpens sp.]
MKTIILIRHAKSSWEYDVNDHERPLKKRGIKDANLVSKAFKAKSLVPDAIYSSSAKRALLTCEIVMENLKLDTNLLTISKEIYDFGGENVIDFIKNISEENQKVMIFGHNHAFTSICNIFGDKYIDNLPTSGLVVIDFNVNSWSEIGDGKTRFMILPRDLK